MVTPSNDLGDVSQARYEGGSLLDCHIGREKQGAVACLGRWISDCLVDGDAGCFTLNVPQP